MSNDLVKQAANTGLSMLAGGGNPFAGMMDEYDVPSSAFLKFSGNTGEFTYKGQVIEHGSTYVFNMVEMKHGWICWKDGKAANQHMVRALSNDRPPAREELEDYGPYKEGEGWANQVSVPVRDLEGGEQMDLNLSSIGGRNALIRLANEFGQKYRMHLDDNGEPKLPVVEINANSFESKKAAGKKWAPTFKIVDWMSLDDLAALASDNESCDHGDEPEAEDQSKDVESSGAPEAQQSGRVQQAASGKPMTRKTTVRPGRRM